MKSYLFDFSAKGELTNFEYTGGGRSSQEKISAHERKDVFDKEIAPYLKSKHTPKDSLTGLVTNTFSILDTYLGSNSSQQFSGILIKRISPSQIQLVDQRGGSIDHTIEKFEFRKLSFILNKSGNVDSAELQITNRSGQQTCNLRQEHAPGSFPNVRNTFGNFPSVDSELEMHLREMLKAVAFRSNQKSKA